MKKKTHKEYVKEVEIINPNIIVIEQYIDAKTPILHKCIIDGCEWYPYPSNVLKGCGCPECRNRKLHEQRAKTQKQYETEVNKLHPTIQVLGNYINSEVAILHKCSVDGYEWMAKPGNIINGKGCPRCARNLQLTNEEYISRLFDVNPNIKPIEKYVNAKTKIWHQCLIDGYLWQIEPSSTLQRCGCPQCAGNIRKTHNEYIDELFIINPDIEVVEQYNGANNKILHRCKLDGFEWLMSPTNALSGNGCSQCQESNGERLVRQWLERHNIDYRYQQSFDNCKDKKILPFDFYIPKYNICIEYDGVQHFKPVDFAGRGEKWATQQLTIIQTHDKIKTKFCKDNNIRLLRISYLENINEILDNYLLNIVT